MFKVYSNGSRKRLSSQNPHLINIIKFCVSGLSVYYKYITSTIIKKYSTDSNYMRTFILNPWFITGFVDAEGSFMIKINSNASLKNKWGLSASFKITLHLRDKSLLEQIQLYFGVGKIYTSGSSVTYEVNSLKELEIIMIHFNKYYLISQKYSDFQLFKVALAIIKTGEHLTLEGLQKIVNIKASMNRGLSNKLTAEFPNTIRAVRPKVEKHIIPDPHWIAGFASGEGCLMVRIRNSSTNSTGYRVELIFQITQHIRDDLLIISLINYIGCGKYRERKKGLAGDYLVYKLSDIINTIIPFFDQYPILGVKSLEYNDFKLISNMMKNKEHLTKEGMNQIIKIRSNMNRNRAT